MGTRPLAGLRVLDLTNVLAGPYCCYQLALLGAEVIKVERPGTGDLARELGADPERNADLMGISFLAQNAGKASVTLDLKSARGRDLLKALVETADVLVENFRPGVMHRLGLGPEVLRAVNPSLVYCAITGFGQDGPRRDDPAYDQIVQGVSGVMSITGTAEAAPLRVGYPLADTIGGMTAAFAISAALAETPRGAVIDVSMTEALLSTMGWVVSNHLLGGVAPAPQGNENPTSAPSGTFQAQDAPINIAANRQSQWESLCAVLDRPDLPAREDFATREARKANRSRLGTEIEVTLRSAPAADWVAKLNAAGVPAGPVLTVEEALADAQVAGRGLVVPVGTGDGALPLVASPVRIDGDRPAPRTAPPRLGADADAVWSGIGLSAEEIAALRREGII